MQKTYIELKVKLVVRADEGASIAEVINEMDYNFKSQTVGAEIEDAEISDFEITDSK